MTAMEIWRHYLVSPMYARDTTASRKRQVEQIFSEFARWMTDAPVTSQAVARWLDERCEGRSNKTYNEYLMIIRQVIKATLSVNGLVVNPANEVPAKKNKSVSRKPYTKEEVEKVLAVVERGSFKIPYHYKTYGKTVIVEREYKIPWANEIRLSIMLGAYCGMRLGDAVNVDASQYDDGFLTYTPAKTQCSSGLEVTVPVLHEGLKAELEKCGGYLTPHLREWHQHAKGDLCKLYRRIFEACGFETRQQCEGRKNASTGGFHALRHSYVTWSAEAGVPLDVVSACVGHNSPITTRIYNHISRQRKAREMARLMA